MAKNVKNSSTYPVLPYWVCESCQDVDAKWYLFTSADDGVDTE